MAPSKSLSHQLSRVRPLVERELNALNPPYTLFFSLCDGKDRAKVVHVRGNSIDDVWAAGAVNARFLANRAKVDTCWLRVDWVRAAEEVTWSQLKQRMKETKRNYFRFGVALDPEFKIAFLEQELNANAMLYGGSEIDHAVINEKNFLRYARERFDKHLQIAFDGSGPVYILDIQGVFCGGKEDPQLLYPPGRNAGRRMIEELDVQTVYQLIDRGSRYLGRQVEDSGVFAYGWHPCFDRSIRTYNSLRHASTTYSMLEAWEVTANTDLKTAIDRALNYLVTILIREVTTDSGEQLAFLVEKNGEIKLGGNAVCLLALVKYAELTGDRQHLPLLERLAIGIRHMQDRNTGQFVHVLTYPDLEVKEAFRIVYYDGEAAFGLMRLYGMTRDSRWLETVELAFEHFIAAEHWKAHDHWLSYCVNELTLYRPEERYYQFGIRNVADHLDFVENRITTFPTLLELMMAAEKMVSRLSQENRYLHLLAQLDQEKFYRALERRASYLLNGHFWPEYAMYFKNPKRILDSFFIRHHAFRVRIDDVEHYLSGYVAYRNYIINSGGSHTMSETSLEKTTSTR